MAINHANKVNNIINLCNRMYVRLKPLANSSELNTEALVDVITDFQNLYGKAVVNYQALIDAGLTSSEISQVFGLQVYPAPVPGSTFNNIAQARNALIVTYENDVWPLFNGETVNRVSGNHVPVSIVKPASFHTALSNMISALGSLVEVD